MENLKELIKFNRYKSVESFNRATDITSSTISIVKLDDNIMDMYLGRTQLTHSDFPEITSNLRNLIDTLSIKLNEIETKFNSDLTYVEEKQNSVIKDLKQDVITLKVEDKHIFELISKIDNEIKNINNDITIGNNTLNNISDKIEFIENTAVLDIRDNKKSINNIIAKQNTHSIDIKNLKNDVLTLHIEDKHIFEIISSLQSVDKVINNEILSIKEKIKYLTGVNVDNFETLEGAHRRLTALENADVKINDKIKELEDYIDNIKIPHDLATKLEENQNTLDEIKETLKDLEVPFDLNNRLDSLENYNEKINGTIEELKETINNGTDTKLTWIQL